MWQYTNLQNVTTKILTCDKTPKLKLWQLKKSKCDKTQKLKMWQNSKTQIVTRLLNSNGDKTHNLKLWQPQKFGLWQNKEKKLDCEKETNK